MNQLNKQYFETKRIHKENFKKSGWILWIGLFLVLVYFIWDDIKLQLRPNSLVESIEEIDKRCLTETEFQFGDIFYQDNLNTIREKIGEPDSIKKEKQTNSEIWYYKDLNIGIVQNQIFYMWCKNNQVSTPSGIKIGLKRNEISKILFGNKCDKFKLKSEYSTIQLVNCKTEIYMILDFNNDILRKLEMGIDLP